MNMNHKQVNEVVETQDQVKEPGKIKKLFNDHKGIVKKVGIALGAAAAVTGAFVAGRLTGGERGNNDQEGYDDYCEDDFTEDSES